MSRFARRIVAVGAVAVTAVIGAAAPATANHPTVLGARLSGDAEVPMPGDPDGRGRAIVLVRSDEVCTALTATKVDTPTAAHIHLGAAGVAGLVVVELPTPTRGAAYGCTTEVDSEVIEDLRDNPENYYVNVHNEPYPGGAVRGQLAALT